MTDYFNTSIKLETVGSLTSSGDTITNENSTNIVIHKNISNISDTLTITKGFSDGTISYTLLEPSAIRDTNNTAPVKVALGIKQVSSLNDSYFTNISGFNKNTTNSFLMDSTFYDSSDNVITTFSTSTPPTIEITVNDSIYTGLFYGHIYDNATSKYVEKGKSNIITTRKSETSQTWSIKLIKPNQYLFVEALKYKKRGNMIVEELSSDTLLLNNWKINDTRGTISYSIIDHSTDTYSNNLYINSNGIGIGVSNPSHDLEIKDIAKISTLTDSVSTLSNGKFTNLTTVNSTIASISDTLDVVTLTDRTSSLTGGKFTGLVTVNSAVASISDTLDVVTLTDRTASLTGGKFTGLVTVNSDIATITTITDGTITIRAGTISFTDEKKIGVTVQDVFGDEYFIISYDNSPVFLLQEGKVRFKQDVYMENKRLVLGTDADDASFIYVDQNSNSTMDIVFDTGNDNTSTNDGTYIFKNKNSSGTSVERMRLNENGYLGIGISNPTKELQVIGTSLLHTLTDGTATLSGGSLSNLVNVANIAATITSVSVSKLVDGTAYFKWW